MFTVTDNLVITTSSPHSGFVILNKLKVPYNDIEERIVHVGKEECVRRWKSMAQIKVKALIDKEKNKVVFVESNADFVDMLFSFLTMPMGTIIRLTGKQPSPITMGSMNNLYKSVQNFSVNYFWTSECKDMLLSPRSGAEAHLKKIEPTLENYCHFFCTSGGCTFALRLMSYYKHTCCPCGNYMDHSVLLNEPAVGDKDGGVFVKGLTRYLISDDLLIFPLSTAASFSLLLKQDVTTMNAIEEKVFYLGKNEILNLLKSFLASKNPLTETLLKNSPIKESNKETSYHCRATKKRKIVLSSGGGDITVKLFLSKTRNVVCFAEANEDFVDLLFSFLTIPLGHIVKELHGNASPFEGCTCKGCTCNLHESVQKLDATNLISDDIKQLLLCPKIAPHFGFHKHLLGVEEVKKQYYCARQGVELKTIVTADKSLLKSRYGIQKLRLLDPKSSCENKAMKSSGGYVKGPTMFTVTDDLVITNSSPFSSFAMLKQLNVSFNDIEERIVRVGKEEAISLLVASFISNSPLTEVFTRKVPKEEYNRKVPKEEY